jgi:hypothetical protein
MGGLFLFARVRRNREVPAVPLKGQRRAIVAVFDTRTYLPTLRAIRKVDSDGSNASGFAPSAAINGCFEVDENECLWNPQTSIEL